MRRLSVDAIAIVHDQNLGRIRLALQEEGFSLKSARTEPISVKYSHVYQYGTCICKHDKQSTTCLIVRYNLYNDIKPNQVCIHLNFDDESVLVAVLEILLEFVNDDPHHLHDTSFELSREIEATSIPHIECQDSSQVSCITTFLVRTQVTFLQFAGNLILAGVGDFLQIFMKEDPYNCWTLLMKRQVFQGQHIHGLRVSSNNYLVVYGGKKVSLLKLFNFGKRKIRSIYSFEAPDWVLDCVWLEDEQAALLTANNALVLCNLSIHKPLVKSVHYCYERCILYSGTIMGKSWNDIVVLAGTVFSTIAIWTNSGDSTNKEIIHRLEGHKGVIFSITFCKKTQHICSTSDDRTVRVWHAAFEEPCNWKTCTITLKFTLYGHSARVWRSSFLECGKIVSVGEDSRICLWNSDGTLEAQFSGHQEGEVWSLDVSEELQFIATGGSDGGISLWPMKKAQVPQELKSIDKKLKPKCVGLSAEGQPFMVSWTGDIFLFNDSTWKLCLNEPELKSYCLHAVTPDHQLIAFGSITGRIVICRLVGNALLKIVDMNVCDGRIFSLMWISNSSFVVCGTGGDFSMWKLSCDTEILIKESDFILPPSKERWVTACSADENYVVCGDRFGSLYLYLKDGQTKNPVHIARKIHGHNGVTDVKYLNGNFVSTGRDGKYREFLVERNELVMLRCCKLKLDWAAAVYDSDLLGRVLFCFHETFFIIWSIKDRREILKIDCGGGHRSWDCTISSERKSIFVTFIKGKSVNYCCMPIEEILCQQLLPGNHPKSINSADFVNLSGEGAGDHKLILLGGEDTTLRLVSVDKDNQTELRVLQRHLSSVRAVACHQSIFDDTLYVASGGGRGQLVFWKAYWSQNETVGKNDVLDVIELNSYSVIPQIKTGASSDSAEMRIMDLQVYQTSSVSVMLAACCSDGILRIFSCSVDTNDILEVQAINLQNCLLKVRVCIATDPLLVVTTTCGSLFIYSIGSSGLLANVETGQRITVSETGINSCDYSEVNGNLILACAGDDALVNILLFDRNSSDMRLKMTDKWVHNAAHTCQVSGLKIVDNLMFTVALDQKLAIFSWVVSGNLVRAEMINRVDLCIPDIHGLLVWPRLEKKSFNILAYGLGTQLLILSVVN